MRWKKLKKGICNPLNPPKGGLTKSMIKIMSLKNPYKKGGMFEKASYLLFEIAKRLRKNMTAAETVLMHIKTGINGFKFRRQHPIGQYIADFYNNDEIRQQNLENLRYKVIRFSNEQVLKQIETVLESIVETIIIQKLNASSKDGV